MFYSVKKDSMKINSLKKNHEKRRNELRRKTIEGNTVDAQVDFIFFYVVEPLNTHESSDSG